MRSSVADKIRIPAALWEGLKRAGITPADVIRRALIPVNALRDAAPVSTMEFFAIWRTLADLSNDPAIGLRIATAVEGAVMTPSFIAAYHARDFRDALQRVSRFKRLCAPEDVLIEERKEQCDIVLDWRYAEDQLIPPALVDATFSSLIVLGRKGTATTLVPLVVELTGSASARSVYERFYGCRVRFRADKNLMRLRSEDLDKPFVTYNSELLDILVPELDRRLEQLSHGGSLVDQVKWVLRRRLTAGRPDIRSVAAELAMSERSLQRKLTDGGMTFQGCSAKRAINSLLSIWVTQA